VAQKYKEGKFILEKNLLAEVEGLTCSVSPFVSLSSLVIFYLTKDIF
jgi:hypothetical protein